MREFLRESIVDYFNNESVSMTTGDFVQTAVTRATLRRSDELDLIIELTSPGWAKEAPERYPVGTVRRTDEARKRGRRRWGPGVLGRRHSG